MAEYNLWTKYDLQEVWVYSMYGFGGMEQDDTAETTAVRTNQCENPAEFWESLKEANIQVVSLKKALMEGAIPRQSTLFVTDCPEVAQKLSTADFPVLGILRKENKAASFSGVRYLAEGWESITPSYLERVYRRCRGLPWQILETKRCILRETIEADVDAFYRIYEEPSITAFMENLFADREEEIRYTADYRKNMYEFYGYGIWGIFELASNQCIGKCGIENKIIDGQAEFELSYVLDYSYWGHGYALEAVKSVLDYAKKQMELERIVAIIDKKNIRSIHFIKRLGFLFEKELYYQNHACYLYSLILQVHNNKKRKASAIVKNNYQKHPDTSVYGKRYS